MYDIWELNKENLYFDDEGIIDKKSSTPVVISDQASKYFPNIILSVYILQDLVWQNICCFCLQEYIFVLFSCKIWIFSQSLLSAP